MVVWHDAKEGWAINGAFPATAGYGSDKNFKYTQAHCSRHNQPGPEFSGRQQQGSIPCPVAMRVQGGHAAVRQGTTPQ
jgi:hypothetical protein